MKRYLLPLLLLFAFLSPPPSQASGSTSYDSAMATYKIMAYDANPFLRGEPMWSGTAWKISPSEMVTAGHVCDNEGGPAPVFRVYNTEGQSWPADVIAYEYDKDHDLCVLRASPPGPSLRLAPAMPAYDSPVFYVGAPLGLWDDGMMPVYHGNYAGGSLVTILGSPGASGSAMQSRHGVVGVLVAGIPGTGLIFIVTLEKLRLFLDANGV